MTQNSAFGADGLREISAKHLSSERCDLGGRRLGLVKHHVCQLSQPRACEAPSALVPGGPD